MTKHSASVIATVAGLVALELFAAPLLSGGPWSPAAVAAAGPIPPGCVEHTPFGNGDDFAGDYRCAGLRIGYHANGVARASGNTWAGQWLFTDESGTYRTGMCTFNRGGHPRADRPSAPVAQTFPNDPSGSKRAYLTWKYGQGTDNVTAAAMWALFHYYAQDAAGSNMAANPSAPLVPSLDVIAENSGRQDLEDLAIALDAEASNKDGAFALDVVLDDAERGRVTVRIGEQAIAGIAVALVITGGQFPGGATSMSIATDAGGEARFDMIGVTEAVSVTATTTRPAASQVYRGVAADPSGVLPQTLLTAGPVDAVEDVASFTVPPTTTTTVPETTTTVPETTTTVPETTTTTTTTTVPETTTTTTVPETTTTVPETTIPETTVPETPVETTVAQPEPTFAIPFVPFDLEVPVDTAPLTVESLPRTGSSSDNAAYFGTALLVAGVGVIGAVRRHRLATDGDGGSGGDDGGDGLDPLGFW